MLALTTALISGVSVFFNKFAVGSVPDPILFAMLKNAAVGALLVGLVCALGTGHSLRTLTRTQWGTLGVIGLVGGAVPFALFFTGLAMVPAATGALIHKTLFIWVALLAAFFLRERLSPVQWLGVALLLAANIVVGGFSGFTGSLGELLILGATLLWAIENIIAKRALVELPSMVVASGRMVFGGLFLLAFLALTGRMGTVATLGADALLWTCVTALFLLGYVLTWYAALKRAPASYVAALLVPAALVTNALSAVFVTHKMSGVQLVQGVLLIVGTVLMVGFARSMAAKDTHTKQLVAEG